MIIGKIVPYICVGYIQMIIAICVGYFGFNIPIKGSLILFILLTTIFMLAILSLGILISTVAQNQMQAMQLSFFVLLPSILLSGFMFPRSYARFFLLYKHDIANDSLCRDISWNFFEGNRFGIFISTYIIFGIFYNHSIKLKYLEI